MRSEPIPKQFYVLIAGLCVFCFLDVSLIESGLYGRALGFAANEAWALSPVPIIINLAFIAAALWLIFVRKRTASELAWLLKVLVVLNVVLVLFGFFAPPA